MKLSCVVRSELLKVSVSRFRQQFIDLYVLSFPLFCDGYQDEKVGSDLELENMKGHLTNQWRGREEDHQNC